MVISPENPAPVADGDWASASKEQSPWAHTGEVPLAWAPPLERPLARILWRRLLHEEPHRFQLILGPRRAGKTVCMYQTVRRLLDAGVERQRLRWLRLDHPLCLRVRLDELVRHAIELAHATAAEPVYLFLDELAAAADWDLWLKTFFDDHWPVRIVATSSAVAALGARQESGVGRWDERYLGPCLLDEQLELEGVRVRLPVEDTLGKTLERLEEAEVDAGELERALERHLLLGGFPGLITASDEHFDLEQRFLRAQEILRHDAIERAIYRDIPQAFGVDDPALLERLLYILAGQTTGILSPQSICKDMHGYAQPTFDRHLSFLERSFLVFTTTNYGATERGTQKRGRKLYFVDGAVRNAALQRGAGPLGDARERSVLFENAAAAHVHALCRASGLRARYWRAKHEVDVVYPHPAEPCAFEIGRSSEHARAGLRALADAHPSCASRRYMVTPRSPFVAPHKSRDGIGSIPFGLFLLAVGKQAALRTDLANYPSAGGDESGGRERAHSRKPAKKTLTRSGARARGRARRRPG